jgi:hypothetical protein
VGFAIPSARRFRLLWVIAAAMLLSGGMVRADGGEGSGDGKAPAAIVAGAAKADIPNPPSPNAERHLEPEFEVLAGVDGEIFPSFASYASLQRVGERSAATVTVNVDNPGTTPLRARVSVQVPGWSDEEIQTVNVPAGSKRALLFAPSFLPRLYSNREITAATAVVKVTDAAGLLMFSSTSPVRLRAVDDMYWGENFRFSRFVASWVTPHDPAVEELLSRAKELIPGRRLPGYEPWKTVQQQHQSTIDQARAIYQALQQAGLSYVKSSITFGERTDITERIRMPRESLQQSSANCIDGVVMYASMFENLAMDPVVVLIPGHALIGVRMMPGSDKFLYIDTVLTGRTDFDSAVTAANNALTRYSSDKITRISITSARQAGVYPMPPGEISTRPTVPPVMASAPKPALPTANQARQ